VDQGQKSLIFCLLIHHIVPAERERKGENESLCLFSIFNFASKKTVSQILEKPQNAGRSVGPDHFLHPDSFGFISKAET